MKARTWQGNEDVQVTDVPDPRIEQPADAVIRDGYVKVVLDP